MENKLPPPTQDALFTDTVVPLSQNTHQNHNRSIKKWVTDVCRSAFVFALQEGGESQT